MISQTRNSEFDEPEVVRGTLSPATSRVVCRCLNVTECDIQNAIACGQVRSVRDVTQDTCAGGGCTSCHRDIRKILLSQGIEEKRPVKSKDAAMELLAIMNASPTR